MEESVDTIERLKKEVELLKQQNARLEEKLNAALDSNGLCLWEQHIPSGQLTIFNMRWGKMLGYQPHELNANVDTWKSNLHPDDYEHTVGTFEDHLLGKSDLYEVTHRMIHKDGSDSWVYDRGRIVEYDSSGNPLRMMGTHIDITTEKRYEQQLAKLASTDSLTGLLNRHGISEYFYSQQHSTDPQKSAMIFFDLDNFKSVNDELGHQAGDRVLINIAEHVNQLAPTSSQVGRIGGDEFVIVCAYSKQQELSLLCEKLLTAVIPAINQGIDNVDIGMSIGVCLFKHGQQQFDDVYQQADSAMYDIKKNGKHGVKIIDVCLG